MKSDIEKIINDAVYAPSGENCQPWKFKVKDNIISIYNIEDRDTSLYNSEQKGSYIAHGALIENFALSAKHFGYKINVELFPDNTNTTNTATISIVKDMHVEKDDLYDYIHKRVSNRKEYTGEILQESEINILTNIVTESDSLNNIFFVTNKVELSKIGHALAVNEQIVFENKFIHDFFYEHLIWDDAKQKNASGFYYKTLEFLPHQINAIKLLKHWFLLKILNKVAGVSKMICKDNGEKYARSGTLIAFTIPHKTKENYVKLGRDIERVWLTATKLGLVAHPCNGTIYFQDKIDEDGGKEFSKKHKHLIGGVYNDIIKGFDIQNGTVAFIFRIGKAESPSAKSYRLHPDIVYVD